MTVGMPGAGIGGLFYLIGALVAPALELYRAVTGDPRPRQWGAVLRHCSIAVMIVAGMAATAWLVGVIAEWRPVVNPLGPPALGSDYPHVMARNLGTFTLTTLVAVIAAVEMLRLAILKPARVRRIAVLTAILSGVAAESAGQSAAGGPALEVGALASGETGAGILGASFGADFVAGDTGRIGVVYQQRRVSSFGDAVQVRQFGGRFNARPRPDVRLSMTGGLWAPGSAGATGGVRPEGTFRLRATPGAAGGVIDLRAHHRPLDVSPELVRNPVLSTQMSAAVDLPIAGALSLRGQGRLASLSRDGHRNRRLGWGGGIAVAATPAVKLSGQLHGVWHSDPFVTGYFAPRTAASAEAGIEIEREFDRATLSLDLGGGLQRVQRGDAPIGPWAPAFRGWGMVAWSLNPGRQLLLEFEAYDSQIANTVTTTERWRYASVTASFRVALAR